MPKLLKPDNNTAKHDTPFTKSNKSKDKSPVVLAPEGSALDKEPISRVEGQKALENIKKLEARMKAEEEGNKTSSQIKKLNKDLSTKISEAEAVAEKPGSGYLSEGSAISMGLIDGDEEIKVLKKVKRLEARLEAERDKVKALGEKLTKLQAAKESVEKEFANTKMELEEKNNDLLEEINALESKLEATESRAIAAEQKLDPLKKELLKTQISETKAQQELYKLKIENLKNDEE